MTAARSSSSKQNGFFIHSILITEKMPHAPIPKRTWEFPKEIPTAEKYYFAYIFHRRDGVSVIDAGRSVGIWARDSERILEIMREMFQKKWDTENPGIPRILQDYVMSKDRNWSPRKW